MQLIVLLCLMAAFVLGCGESTSIQSESAKRDKPAIAGNKEPIHEVSTTIPALPAANTERLETPAAGEPLELEYLPHDAFAALVFNARRAFQSKALAPLPYDELLRTSIEAWSFDPRDVEHWLLFFTPPVANEPLGTPYSPAAIVRFVRPVDGYALVARRGGELKESVSNGKRYYVQTTQPATAFYLPDDRTIVFAAEEQLKKMLSTAQVNNRLVERLQQSGMNFDLHVVVDVESLTPALDALSRFAGQQLPPTVLPYVKALGDVSMVTATIDLSGDQLLMSSIEARDAEAAKRLHQLARESQPVMQLGYSVLRGLVVRAWTHQAAQSVLDVTDPVIRRAIVVYEPDSIHITAPKPPTLDDLGRRLHMAMERNTARR